MRKIILFQIFSLSFSLSSPLSFAKNCPICEENPLSNHFKKALKWKHVILRKKAFGKKIKESEKGHSHEEIHFVLEKKIKRSICKEIDSMLEKEDGKKKKRDHHIIKKYLFNKNPSITLHTIYILRYFALNRKEYKTFYNQSGITRDITKLINSKNRKIAVKALELLRTISHDNKEAWPTFHKNKTIENLVKILKEKKVGEEGLKESLRALINIGVDSKENEKKAEKAGVLPILKKLTQHKNKTIAEEAEKAFRFISSPFDF